MNKTTILALTLALAACEARPSAPALGAFGTTAQALTGAGVVSLGFNAPESTTDVLGEDLASFIDGATVSVDAALYKVTQPAVVASLIAADDRGVTVRLVTDTTQAGAADAIDAYAAITAAGIPVIYDDKSSDMHNKFLVRDSATVWVGSYNPLDHPTMHAENALTIEDAAVAAAFSTEFAEMFGGAFSNDKTDNTTHNFTVGGAPVAVYFSPTDDVETQIVSAVAGAQDSVDFLAFSFSSDAIGAALLARADAGVVVRGAVERLQATQTGSEFLGLLDAGLDVRKSAFSTFLHHKIILIDANGANPKLVTGSYNFTAKASDRNDESLVIIEDRAAVSAYLAMFEDVFGACAQLNADAAQSHALVITEVHANALDESSGEFVEVVNSGTVTVSLRGLNFFDGDTYDRVVPFDGGASTIGPGEVFVIIDPDRDLSTEPVAEGIRLFTVENGTLGDGLTTSDVAHLFGPDLTNAVSSFSFPRNPGNGYSVVRNSLEAGDATAAWTNASVRHGTAGIFPEPTTDPWGNETAVIVDVNTADAPTLETVSGIGPSLASRIVNDRAANGVFCAVDELTRVSGIGSTSVERIRDQVTVGDPLACRPKVDINTAAAAALDTLPGIGPALAGRIVADRDANGLFPDTASIQRVRGIGATTYANIEAGIIATFP